MTTRHRIAMIGIRGLASAPPASFVQNGRFAVGGAELAAEELAVRLARRGHSVTLYSRGGERSAATPNLTIEPAWYWAGRRTEALSHSVWATLRAIVSRFDLVHFHAVGPGSCALLARMVGLPSVLTVQGLDWQREKWLGWEQRLLRRLANTGIRRADACVAVAPSLVEPVRSIGGRDVEFIPNGFSDVGRGEPSLLDGLALQPGRYLLCMSRLVPEKNLHLVIEAYRHSLVSWPLVIAGGSSGTDGYVDELKGLAGGSPAIRFVGVVQGALKATLLENAGAFLNASSIEGLSLAIVEALGQGIPVAVSPIAPNLDVFKAVPGAPAPIILDTSSIERMAVSIRLLTELTEPQRAAWHDAAPRARERYSWDTIVARLEDVYQRVVARRNGLSEAEHQC